MPNSSLGMTDNSLSWSRPRRRTGVWTRVHGIVSLELSAAFKDMGLDGGALLDDEVKRVVDSARGRG